MPEVATVEKEFCMHFRHLRAKCKRQRSNGNTTDNIRNARRIRRKKLLEYRTKGCSRFEQLDHLAQPIGILGSDGMSDDESDHDNGPRTGNRTFTVTSVWWRSKNPQFMAILELFDLLYMSTKFKRDGTPHPGNWPRVRIRVDDRQPQNQGKPVPGLPENFYDNLWLQELRALDPTAIDRLMIQPAINLAIDPRIIT